MATLLQQYLFQNPPSIYLKVTEIMTLVGSVQCGYSEAKGLNLKYSKFAGAKEEQGRRISSRKGMVICYAPSLIVSSIFFLCKLQHMKYVPSFLHKLGLASFGLHQKTSLRLMVVALALTIHFLKRELEVLFVHRYSGEMTLKTALLISWGYFFSSVNLLYAQQLCESMRPPAVDLMWVGMGVFLVGICGNFYHHYLLSRQRKNGQRGYVVPQGGFFALVVCPHYLFEIIDFLGMALISQTVFGLFSLAWTTFYLMGRSYATRQWYLHKMEDFPKYRRALIPFIF